MEKNIHPWIKAAQHSADMKNILEKHLLESNEFKRLEMDYEYKRDTDRIFEDLKKSVMIRKYGKEPEVKLHTLEKRGVFKVDNKGNWELVSKCNTQEEAVAEIEWRAKEFKVEIDKKTSLAQTIAPYRGTYVIFPVYEIK